MPIATASKWQRQPTQPPPPESERRWWEFWKEPVGGWEPLERQRITPEERAAIPGLLRGFPEAAREYLESWERERVRPKEWWERAVPGAEVIKPGMKAIEELTGGWGRVVSPVLPSEKRREITEPYEAWREETVFGELPVTSPFTKKPIRIGGELVEWTTPDILFFGGVSKGPKVTQVIVKAIERGTSKAGIVKLLTETVQAGKKFTLTQARTEIRKAEEWLAKQASEQAKKLAKAAPEPTIPKARPGEDIGLQPEMFGERPPEIPRVPPVREAVPPTAPPKPPVTPPPGVPPPKPPAIEPIDWAKARVPSLPSAEVVLADLSKKVSALARRPLFKRAVELFTKEKSAVDTISQTKLLQGRLKDISDQFSTLATTHLERLTAQGAKPKIVDGIVDKATKIAPLEGAPKLPSGQPSMHAHDIVEYAERYNIPAKVKPYFDEIRAVSKEATKMLETELDKFGVKLRKMAGEADWVYLRRIVKRMGDVDAQGFANWRGTQRPRVFETAAAGAEYKKPITYLDPEKELLYQVQSAYNWIISLRVREALTKLTTTAKARVPARITEELVTANTKRIAADKLYGSYNTPSLIMRIGRGEIVPPQTLASVRQHFPEFVAKLEALMKKGATQREAIALRREFADSAAVARSQFLNRKSAYKRALEQAGPHFEEGSSWFLPGRIFTTQELAGKKVIGEDIARMVEAQFGFQKPNLMERMIAASGRFGTVLRQTKAALDLSVQGIQTLPALGIDTWNLIKLRPTVTWFKGAARGWQRFFRPKDALAWADQSAIKAAQEECVRHGGLAVSVSEFAEATDILGKAWVVGGAYRRSGAAFTIGRSATQTYLYMAERAWVLRKAKTEAEITKALSDLARSTNVTTGAFSSRGAGIGTTQRSVENSLMFSARLNRSIGALVNNCLHGGISGKMAIEAVTGLLAATYAHHTFLALAMGQKPRLNPLPESIGGDGAKWLCVKVGPMYIGVGGTIHMLVRLSGLIYAEFKKGEPENLISLSMDNPIVRAGRAKFGPPAALITDFVTGHDYLGELTRENWGDVAKTFGEWGVPIWVEGMADAIKQDASFSETLAAGAWEIFGGRTFPETDWDRVKILREIYSEEDFGKQYKDLNKGQVDKLLRNHPDLNELVEASKAKWAETGTEFERWYYPQQKAVIKRRDDGLKEAAQALFEGKVSKYQYDQERGYLRPYYSGGMGVLWSAREGLDPDAVRSIERWLEKNEKPEDKVLGEYQELRGNLIDKAELPRDWDKIEEQLSQFLSRHPMHIQRYVMEMRDAWIERLPEPARRVELERLKGIEDGTWWDNYRGDAGRKTPLLKPSWEQGEPQGGITPSPSQPLQTPETTTPMGLKPSWEQ